MFVDDVVGSSVVVDVALMYVGVADEAKLSCLCGMRYTCGEQNESVVLTPDMLRGKNPVGEKVLSTEALIAYVHWGLSCEACLEMQM